MPEVRRGEIYIGVIIAIGILAILSQAVIALVFSSYNLISFTRARINARHLAGEQMEIIHNLPFSDVGTVGGIPPGILQQEEQVELNGLSYLVKTSVVYMDDPFDGLAPEDTLPNDYKRVRIDVSWGGIAKSGSNTITLVSDIAPKGIETTIGGGTIQIMVFDAQGQPVSGADTHIVADSVDPQVDLTLQTNINGIIVLPGAPICDSCYQITVSREGFSTDRTYSTSEIANPSKPHLTVIEGELTEVSFAIDVVGTMSVSTFGPRDGGFLPLGNQIVRIRGEKIIGTTDTDEPVYKFDEQVVTNSLGTLTIENLEWDNYYAELPSDSTKVISGSNPLSPISALPGEDVNLKLSLDTRTDNSLRIVFTNSGGDPVPDVTADLTGPSDYDETVVSGLETDPDWGQSFFNSLEAGLYQLNTTAVGYEDFVGEIEVSAEKIEFIILNSL